MQNQHIETIQKLGIKNQILISRCLDMGLICDVKQLQKIDAQLRELLHKANFNPNQPRDEIGRWTDAGGGGKITAWPRKPIKPAQVDYNPEDDELYQVGVYVFGYPTYAQLHFYSDFIEEQAKDNNIDPSLIKGVILNESATRGGASLAEAIPSAILSDYGTYGLAQLGPAAREAVDLNIVEVLTISGAIIGAANFLSAEKQRLITEGIKNPTNGQIATRYNQGSWDSSKPITKYGVRVEYLVDRFYNQ